MQVLLGCLFFFFFFLVSAMRGAAKIGCQTESGMSCHPCKHRKIIPIKGRAAPGTAGDTSQPCPTKTCYTRRGAFSSRVNNRLACRATPANIHASITVFILDLSLWSYPSERHLIMYMKCLYFLQELASHTLKAYIGAMVNTEMTKQFL